MFTVICVETNEEINIQPSKIKALRPHPINDETIVRFVGNRGNIVRGNFYIKKSFNSVLKEIESLSGDLDKIGDFHFWAYNDFHRPVIDLLREEDGSVHQTYCLKCGYVQQSHHSQTCDCKIERKYEGKMKGNSLSQQIIILSEESLSNLDIDKGILFNEFGEHIVKRTASNIKVENGSAFATVKFKGAEIKIQSSSYLFENGLKACQAVWYS